MEGQGGDVPGTRGQRAAARDLVLGHGVGARSIGLQLDLGQEGAKVGVVAITCEKTTHKTNHEPMSSMQGILSAPFFITTEVFMGLFSTLPGKIRKINLRHSLSVAAAETDTLPGISCP